MAANAQASVPVPEGLDLDAWIVPPPSEPAPSDMKTHDGETGERKVKKSKKGKGKEVSETKGKGVKKRRKEDGHGGNSVVLMPTEPETAEELVERERVCICLSGPCTIVLIMVVWQRKAERRAQLRDDPYYIIDDKPPKPQNDDVDSIPVVQLEGMPSLIQGLFIICAVPLKFSVI